MTIWNTRQGRNDRVRVGQSKRIWGAGISTWPRWEGCGNNEFWAFSWRSETKVMTLTSAGRPFQIRGAAVWNAREPNLVLEGGCTRRFELDERSCRVGFVMAQQRGQIRWCACAENFVCESSYFEMDPRCHWEPVKFIEQWSGTAQSIRLQNDAGHYVLLALKLSGQGLRHAIHDGVGVVKSGAHQSVSNQSGGVGIEDGTNVAKSSDVVLRGLLYQAYMFVESKRWINGNAQ